MFIFLVCRDYNRFSHLFRILLCKIVDKVSLKINSLRTLRLDYKEYIKLQQTPKAAPGRNLMPACMVPHAWLSPQRSDGLGQYDIADEL